MPLATNETMDTKDNLYRLKQDLKFMMSKITVINKRIDTLENFAEFQHA
jgi:hypothetical protein